MMRKEKPTGEEIAGRAQKSKLDKGSAVSATKGGRKITFTPAELPSLESVEELEEGQIIGTIESELDASEGLEPGKYDLFLANVGGNWKVYAETAGKVVTETTRVKIERHHWGEYKKEKPVLRFEESFCFRLCLVHLLWWCLVSVEVCFG